MRFEAITNDKGTTLLFTGEGGPDSITFRHVDLAKMTVPEAIRVVSRVGELLAPVPDDGFFELHGDDEPDEDLSVFEEAYEVDWEGELPTDEV